MRLCTYLLLSIAKLITTKSMFYSYLICAYLLCYEEPHQINKCNL